MDSTGTTQTAAMPTAAGARAACGSGATYRWLDADAKALISTTFVDVPANSTHRHRRPWEAP